MALLVWEDHNHHLVQCARTIGDCPSADVRLGQGAEEKSGVPKRQNTGAARSAPGLSKEAIVTAALAQIDESGLAVFSMRSLAQALGVYPTAVYWYLPSRNAILAEVVALVIAEVVPQRSRDWRDWLRKSFFGFRRAIATHPNVAPLLGAQIVSNTSVSIDLIEGVLTSLDAAGFVGLRLVAAYNAVMAGFVGFITQEFAPMPDDAPAWQQAMQDRVRSLHGGAYPMVNKHLDRLANRAFILRWQNGVDVPLDEGFSFYVEALIAGIDALRQD
jgi:TetR/AcrR family tetracycline transcriptional repressor